VDGGFPRLLATVIGAASGEWAEQRVIVGDVELHYVEQGRGDAVISPPQTHLPQGATNPPCGCSLTHSTAAAPLMPCLLSGGASPRGRIPESSMRLSSPSSINVDAEITRVARAKGFAVMAGER